MKFIFISLFALAACSTTKTDNLECKTDAKPDCVCTQQYQPVCGCDGKTYGNACMANCAGVKKFTDGECK